MLGHCCNLMNYRMFTKLGFVHDGLSDEKDLLVFCVLANTLGSQ